MNVNNIPQELKTKKQWVVYTLPSKQPFDPKTGKSAQTNNPATWGSFYQAMELYTNNSHKFAGVGFVFDNDYIGIDIDNCRDPKTGKIVPEINEIIASIGSYTEVSQSGTGVHIIVGGTMLLDKGNRVTTSILGYNETPVVIEIYVQRRYFITTGNIINNLNNLIRKKIEIYDKYFNKSIIPQKINTVNSLERNFLEIGLKKDKKLIELWNGERPNGNESVDDMALFAKLAYWCNCDLGKMTNAFLESIHFQTKDTKHQKKSDEREDYIRRTCEKAITTCVTTAKEDNNQFTIARYNELNNIMEFQYIEVNQELLKFRIDDDGNAMRIMYLYGTDVRYNVPTKRWYIWDGKRWKPDFSNEIYWRAMYAAKAYQRTVQERYSEDPKAFKRLFKESTYVSNIKKIKAAVEAMSFYPAIKIELVDLDGDKTKDLLNFKNGTVNLKTGVLKPHDHKDYITKLVSFDYKPDALCPKYDEFINYCFFENKDKLRYIDDVLGYCLTGHAVERCFFILCGSGGNGKSTLVQLIAKLIEEYSTTIPITALMHKQRNSNANPELARIRGTRLVTTGENDEVECLNEGQIKQITGNDKIFARFCFDNGSEFLPECKIMIFTNHKPQIKGTDEGIWDRVRIFEFLHKVPEEKKNVRLIEELLQEEAEGILAKLVRGAVRWYEYGLKTPEVVKTAIHEYRKDMDVVGSFLEECTIQKKGEMVPANMVYKRYTEYCRFNGIETMSQQMFGRKIKERGIEKKVTKICNFYKNILLKTEVDYTHRPNRFEETPKEYVSPKIWDWMHK